MKVVTGVVGNDIHVVANRLIDLSLQARGYKVFDDTRAIANSGSTPSCTSFCLTTSFVRKV